MNLLKNNSQNFIHTLDDLMMIKIEKIFFSTPYDGEI